MVHCTYSVHVCMNNPQMTRPRCYGKSPTVQDPFWPMHTFLFICVSSYQLQFLIILVVCSTRKSVITSGADVAVNTAAILVQ